MTFGEQEGNLHTLVCDGPAALALVHPASGMASAFRRLPPYLPGGFSLLAFENAQPDDDTPCSVAALSEVYADQLLRQPFGDVVLAGWSFGGTVAVELAVRLEAAGRTVSGVILIDSAPPEVLARTERTRSKELAGLFELSAEDERAIASASSPEESWDLVLRVLRERHRLPSLTMDDLQPFLSAYSWHLAAIRAPWTPPARLGCPVVQIRAEDETGWGNLPGDLGWAETLNGTVHVAGTPGDHYNLLSAENVPFFARVLMTCLKRLDWPK
ncbi:alpha/beta fold hydrolase [Nonomuraea sp. NPDC005692]|uniref:thioesterase domain-containing protein n=1 Tax=Nonomuraea sp. NPDC005692 TaxID=3157168 RepID=UPI0033C522D2